MIRNRNFLLAAVMSLLLATAIVAREARAEEWPTRAITLVVTFPPGGGADMMARLIAPKLGEQLGQQVVVENRSGASGQIGAAAVARAPADGYTLMLDAFAYGVNPSLYPGLPYDPAKAFSPLAVLALYPTVLVFNPALPVTTVGEFVQLAKAKPGGVAFASGGSATAQYFAGALFEIKAGVKFTHVPYKGSGPALIDVMSGQVPVFFANISNSLQHIRSGKLRALAVTGDKRIDLLPEVPTVQQGGVANYAVYDWTVVVAPAATPADIQRKISLAIQRVMATPEVGARVAELGGVVFDGDQARSAAFIRDQTALWANVIRENNIKPD